MSSNNFQSNTRDRAKSAAATAAIHLAAGALFVTGLAIQPGRKQDDGLRIFDIKEPPPPTLPASELSPTDKNEPAAAAKKADPSPMVAPPAKLPTTQPVAAAQLAGSGLSPKSGEAASGSGTGAGGTGAGRGSGGGGGGGGIGTEARLVSGNRSRLPRALLQSFAADRGYAHLLLTVTESGNVSGCGVIQGTGNQAVDDALCQVMIRQSRWVAARDTAGQPITVQVRYTSVWSKD